MVNDDGNHPGDPYCHKLGHGSVVLHSPCHFSLNQLMSPCGQVLEDKRGYYVIMEKVAGQEPCR